MEQDAFRDRAAEKIEEQVAASRQQREAQRQPSRRAEPPQKRFKQQSDALRASIVQAKQQDRVKLPRLSKTSPGGEEIWLKCRRMTLQELTASQSLPTRADYLVTELIDRSLDATKNARSEWGLSDEDRRDTVEGMIEDIYGGWTREALAAFFEFQCVMVCAAVIDDRYRFVMTQEEVDENPEMNVLVWDIPDEDINAIFSWVLDQEERAVDAVMPFRGSGEAAGPVPSEPEPVVSAERADSI